jgi:SAM-dependent methyltransferase
VLDLGCGDGTLCELLARRGCWPVGIDRERHAGTIRACAEALPFADRSFDAAASHLAFMVFDDAAAVACELARVLRPGAPFVATLGGGPTAHGDDAFHRFLALARFAAPRRGDPRAKTEAGWRTLFGERVTFERHELDASGTADEVWDFLAAIAGYELATVDPAPLRAALAMPGRVECRAVIWIATAFPAG